MVLNIAHRGGAGLAPENTLSCFKEGAKYADMLELDVQPSKDKQIMVFHDKHDISRTTNGQGKIPLLDFTYLRSLDTGGWFHPDFKGEVIPTLNEVLEHVISEIHYNIELKYYNSESDWFENEVIKAIKHFNVEQRTIITARHPENIIRIQEIDPSIECALLQKERDNNEYLQLARELNLKTVQIRRSALNDEYINNCHDLGIRVFFFYADELYDMKSAIKLGIDGILTNYPNRLKLLLTKDF